MNNNQKQKFADWMVQSSKLDGSHYSSNTIDQYRGYISRMSDLMTEMTGRAFSNLFNYTSPVEAEIFFERYKAEIEPLWNNGKKNSDFKSAFKLYLRFLAETESDYTSPQVELQTEKQRLFMARYGQGDFRKSLVCLWKGQCSVTGYPDTGLLVASHIKPWSACDDTERLDPYNGFLLSPNLDKAFDRARITFDQDGYIKISRFLIEPEKLGVLKGMQVKLHERHQVYLDYHRRKFNIVDSE